MSRKYFGTDGVRGRVGAPPLTVDFALRLASAAARVLAPNGGKVLVGKDTRLSGYMFEAALEAGFVAAGVDVLMIGPLPTPAIAYLTQKFECNFGVVISASHNLYEDNGIKFFCNKGGKLTDEAEAQIERHLEEPPITRESPKLGTARRVDKSRVHYQVFCSSTIPADVSLSGIKIVMDCAHGAGYKVGPRTLADLGAEVIPIGCSPNGRNINLNCGSTSPQLLQMMVPGVKADLGIALDGDGDRLVMVDAQGNLVDGDQLLYIIAHARKAAGQLVGPVVGTVMSNLGLEHALTKEGIAFKRAKVGDRYVLEMLRESGGVLGGETSGHLLCLDKTTTGDALISALQVLAIIKQSGKTLAQLAEPMHKYPQILENVRVAKKIDVTSQAIQVAVKKVEQRLNGAGRVVLRPSGTEPVIRVMVEGREEPLVRQLAKELASSVAAAAA
ncbi:MAG TPA: phosphoglucosamine mutase [Steroidobacteraceae bacterium]|nr:phosphoglucosamine mutase [Steroidobacteraceae bacterium]